MTFHITIPAIASIVGAVGYLVLPDKWAELSKLVCLAGGIALLVNLK